MSFVKCIQSAIDSGRIRPEKGKEAIDAYDRTVDEMKAKGLGDREAADAASLAATERLTKSKGDTRWRRLREMQVAYSINQALETKGLKPWEVPAALIEGDDRFPFANVQTRHDRIRGQLHAMIESGLEKYRPRAAGIIHPVAGMDSLVREAFGEKTGDVSAKEIAAEFAKAAEHARKRANRAGAAIHELENWRIPQMHDRLKMRQVGRDAWVQQHMGWLDWDAMKHPDGSDILPAERQGVLESVYDTLITDGYVKIRPGQKLPENLAARLSHQRFLYYKDADSWLAANKSYGDGDAFHQMLAYLDGMSRDIALMEVLGPNPSAMKAFVEQSVRKRAADMDVSGGKGKTNIAKADEALADFDEMYAVLTHANAMGEESGVGHTMAGLRNVITSAFLGAATLAAIPGDLLLTKHAALFNKLPAGGHIRQYLKLMNPASAADRRLAVRSGLIAESSTAIALGHQRFFGAMAGPQLTRRISDTTMRLSLMSPHTQAAKWAFGMETMGAFADYAGKGFDALPFRGMLERHGITAAEWDIFRATPAYDHKGAKFLRPDDVLARTDLDDRTANAVADKFMDMILYERKYAVPESSIRARQFLVSDTRGGTMAGEVLRSLAMFKNFPVTIMLSHMQRGLQLSTYGGRAAYLGSFFGVLTLGGALAVQANEIASGRDPMDMTDIRFWGKAALKGGGLGYLGDFMFSELNRYGSGLQDMVAGPVVQFFSDLRNVTMGNLAEAVTGEDTNAAKELAAFGTRYAPGSTLWYLKLAFRRIISDQLQAQADPAAYQRFREIENKALRDYGQGHWWAPGETEPERGPDLGAAFGAR